MNKRYGRSDSNQSAIIHALTQAGATVANCAQVGGGFPDLVVGFRGNNYMMEIKDGNAKLRTTQTKWHSEWRGQVATVRTIEEALAVIGAV